MSAPPVGLVDVADLRHVADEVVAAFSADLAPSLATAEVHHVGATALPFGHTKRDVDVNVRVGEARFARLVEELSGRLTVAQPENWTATFASFASDGYAVPLGVQVTVIGSRDDFLLSLRDRMRDDLDLLRRYDGMKLAAAPEGPAVYWAAKNAFLRELLSA